MRRELCFDSERILGGYGEITGEKKERGKREIFEIFCEIWAKIGGFTTKFHKSQIIYRGEGILALPGRVRRAEKVL
ncbi:MAG: hypothetical protein IJ597_04930 [Synergistaceae bacterium]|nr:hypothetical protein [Synergistaceae bacterium]